MDVASGKLMSNDVAWDLGMPMARTTADQLWHYVIKKQHAECDHGHGSCCIAGSRHQSKDWTWRSVRAAVGQEMMIYGGV